MAKNNNLQDFLVDVADAIRNKKIEYSAIDPSTYKINPQNFAAEISAIPITPNFSLVNATDEKAIPFDWSQDPYHIYSPSMYFSDPTYDGFRQFTFSPATSVSQALPNAYDIREGVNILGVSGTYSISTATRFSSILLIPSTNNIIVDYSTISDYDGANYITVGSVTNAIDPSIQPNNIKAGVSILGVTGTYAGALNEPSITITPSSEVQVIGPKAGYAGYESIYVESIQASQFYKPEYTVTVTPSLESYAINASEGYAISRVVVNSVIPSYMLSFSTVTLTPSIENTQWTTDSNIYVSAINVTSITANLIPNLTPENIRSGATILGVTGTFTSGVSPKIASIVAGTFTGGLVDYTGEISFVASYKFYAMRGLTGISFPCCSVIQNSAFFMCANLRSINLPICSYIGDSAFYYCSNLQSISLPACTSIGVNAFAWCESLTSVTAPLCTNLAASAFEQCSRLTTIDLPECTILSSWAFRGCLSLTSISIPKAASIGSYAFNNCIRLANISLPACSYISSYAFGNTGLYSVYLGGSISLLASSTFTNLPSLCKFYLNTSSMVSITTYTFGGFLTGSSTYTIYVPSSLYAQYISSSTSTGAQNHWSFYSSRIISVSSFESLF